MTRRPFCRGSAPARFLRVFATRPGSIAGAAVAVDPKYRFRPGQALAVDDESGLSGYRSDMQRDWNGSLRFKDNLDGRHPNLDAGKRAAQSLEQALKDIRERPTIPICRFTRPTIGNTTIFTRRTPATIFAAITSATGAVDASATRTGMVIAASGGAMNVCGPFVVFPNNF